MWIFDLMDNRLSVAFQSFWAGFIGFLLLPWTALAYAVCFAPGSLTTPRGVNGIGWAVVVLGLLADLSSYGGGDLSRRRRQNQQPAGV